MMSGVLFVDKWMTQPKVHKLVNYRDLLALNCDGRWHTHPGAQRLFGVDKDD